jgi:hypothetical protein
MQRPPTLALLSTLGVAVLLTALSWELGGTKFEWLIVPFVMPGMFLAAIVFPEGVHSDHALMWLGLAEIINFFLAWLSLLLIAMLLQKLILRRREHS